MPQPQVTGAFDSLSDTPHNVPPGSIPGTLASQTIPPSPPPLIDPASVPLPTSKKRPKPPTLPPFPQTAYELTKAILETLDPSQPIWNEDALVALAPSQHSDDLEFGYPPYLTRSEASLNVGDTASVYKMRISALKEEREGEYVPVAERVGKVAGELERKREEEKGPSSLMDILTYAGGGGKGWGCDNYGYSMGGSYIKFLGDFTGEFMHIDCNTRKCYISTTFKWRVPSHTEEQLKDPTFHPILPGFRYARKVVELDIAIFFTGEPVAPERRPKWYRQDKDEDVNGKWLHEGVFGRKRTYHVVIERGRFEGLRVQEAPFEYYPKFWLRMTWDKTPIPARRYWKEYEDVISEEEKKSEYFKKRIEAYYQFVEKRRDEKMWYGYAMNKVDKMSACPIL